MDVRLGVKASNVRWDGIQGGIVGRRESLGERGGGSLAEEHPVLPLDSTGEARVRTLSGGKRDGARDNYRTAMTGAPAKKGRTWCRRSRSHREGSRAGAKLLRRLRGVETCSRMTSSGTLTAPDSTGKRSPVVA